MADDKKYGMRDIGKGEDFLQAFKRGIQFTEELLEENERLKYQVIRLEEENRAIGQIAMSAQAYEELIEKMKLIEEEHLTLMVRYHSAEDQTKEFKGRYLEIEEENNRLANLYIASYQLHSSLDLKEVVRICFEIIINLVGSMDFALFIADDRENLVPVRTQGRALDSLPEVAHGQGVIGRAAMDRMLYISGHSNGSASLDDPMAVVPLIVRKELLGAFVIYSFLNHKPSMTDLDRELLNLLAGHAGTAICSARLHMEAARVKFGVDSYLKALNS